MACLQAGLGGRAGPVPPRWGTWGQTQDFPYKYYTARLSHASIIYACGVGGYPNNLMRPVYPFTAIVGQERMKRSLVLNAVDQRIGGVLIRGERGTGKSTAAPGFAR